MRRKGGRGRKPGGNSGSLRAKGTRVISATTSGAVSTGSEKTSAEKSAIAGISDIQAVATHERQQSELELTVTPVGAGISMPGAQASDGAVTRHTARSTLPVNELTRNIQLVSLRCMNTRKIVSRRWICLTKNNVGAKNKPFHSVATAPWTGGQGTVPNEQKTQQSP